MSKVFFLGLSVILSGCASMTSNETLTEKAEWSIGLEKNEVSLSDRDDGFLSTDYKVKTEEGKNYNCSVAKILGLIPVGQAICNERGKPASNPFLSYRK